MLTLNGWVVRLDQITHLDDQQGEHKKGKEVANKGTSHRAARKKKKNRTSEGFN